MSGISTLQTVQPDRWVRASWDEFAATVAESSYQESRAYYDQGYMRLEMAPLGAAHGQDNSLLSSVVIFYGMVKRLPIKELINTSFRKIGVRECQPDLAYYLGSAMPNLPRTNEPIDVNTYGPPTLVIEIGASSFSDDLGAKRLLYEQLGVEEYWVVNTAEQTVIIFDIANGRSGRIDTSLVLPNLSVALVNEALQRSAQGDITAIGQWLLDEYGRL